MRQRSVPVLAGILGICTIGCVSELIPPDQSGITAVLGIAVDAADTVQDPTGGSSTGTPADPVPDSLTSEQRTLALAGRLTASGEYELFDLGAGRTGDRWEIAPARRPDSAYVVALFDADMNLLRRLYVVSQRAHLVHVLREDTPQVIAGVMAPVGTNGGDYRFLASIAPGAAVPGPRPQVIWLNFGAGSNVRIQNRAAVSFDAFQGSMLGAPYVDATQVIKDTIVELVRADYAPYGVTILSSDDGPPPEGTYSVLHFGAEAPGLLGLADSVDAYNSDPSQQALIYVESFAAYQNMGLTPEEMGVMIANVASHELGHLLGLYHTRDPQDVMDITANAWQLAENQSFLRAPLEPSVFAVGMEDTPRILVHSVGYNEQTAKRATVARAAKLPTYRALRRFIQDELPGACGTCLALDHQ